MSRRTREGWLADAVRALRPYFRQKGYPLPPKIAAMCGFAVDGNLAQADDNLTVAQCWGSGHSPDGTAFIFISPIQKGETKVVGSLVHELIHLAIGIDRDHDSAEWRNAMKVFGMTGRPAACTPSRKTRDELMAIVGPLGPYPHAGFKVFI